VADNSLFLLPVVTKASHNIYLLYVRKNHQSAEEPSEQGLLVKTLNSWVDQSFVVFSYQN